MFRLLSEVIENCTEVKKKCTWYVLLLIIYVMIDFRHFFQCDTSLELLHNCVLLIFRKIAEKIFFTHAVTVIFCSGHLTDTFIQGSLQMRNITNKCIIRVIHFKYIFFNYLYL